MIYTGELIPIVGVQDSKVVVVFQMATGTVTLTITREGALQLASKLQDAALMVSYETDPETVRESK